MIWFQRLTRDPRRPNANPNLERLEGLPVDAAQLCEIDGAIRKVKLGDALATGAAGCDLGRYAVRANMERELQLYSRGMQHVVRASRCVSCGGKVDKSRFDAAKCQARTKSESITNRLLCCISKLAVE